MKKWVKGLLIFALFVFVVGVGCIIAGISMGISSGDVEAVAKHYIPYLDDDFIKSHVDVIEPDDSKVAVPQKGDLEGSTSYGQNYEFTKDQIRELELDLANVECRILPSDTEQVFIKVKEDTNQVTVKMDVDCLEVECDPNFWNEDTVSIDVFLPQDFRLDEFYLTTGAGKVEIDCPIHTDKSFIEMGAAALTCSNLFTAADFELEVGAGSARFTQVDAAKVELENASGKTDIHLTGQKEEYGVTMEVAVGEISYGGEQYASSGREFTDIPKDATKSIEIECAAGAVNITFDETTDKNQTF